MRNYYNYYLVALNLEEDKMNPRIINLDNSKLQEDDEKELTNIAYIDNLTSKYEEGVFRRYLYDKKILKDIYTPVFIVRFSNSYEKDNFGNRKTKTSIKFYCPIFKSKDSELVNNIALTTIRQRNISISECSYLLQYFEALYYNNEEYRDIVNYVINDHDIKHLLNYKVYIKDTKSNPIKYTLLRDVVSTLYEFEKSKTFERFVNDVYGREDYIREIKSVLPEKINVKKGDFKPVVRDSYENIERIKHEEWDNIDAKEQFKNSSIKERTLLTLTLEDKLRAGLIDANDYSNTKEKYETKFRK